MTQARDGGLILAGRTASQGSGGYDAWIVKVDSDGGPIWNSTLGGSDDQAAHSVIENGDGIILAGLTGGEGAGGDMWLVKLEAALGSSQAENSIPKIIELLPDLKSPQLAGVAVTWTALAKDVENDTLEFQFKIDGATARDWSSNQAWTLVSGESAIGSHEIEVGVRDGKHAIDGRADASMVMQYVFQSEPEQNSPPVVDSLSADPAGPAPVGTTIIWTAHASDPDGDHLEYRFTQDGIVARDWSGSNAFEMTPAVRMLCTASSTDNMSVCQAEEAVIEVEAGVRDGKHATDGRSDATMTAYLSIESERQVALSSDELEANRSFAVGAPMNAPENLPPIVTSLTADPASPQPFGTAVRFTAIAADPDGDPIEYGFVTGNTSIRDWSEDNVLIWQPGYPHYSVGTTEIFLEIRDKKHSEFADAWMSIEYTLLPA
ncbi:MAG TPA: hypothetical protein PLI05_05855 [Methanotrichaceae archaeon]|nr:hypothetical protein [Methanotrichaceae archaeon]HQF16575.1 hypothetical protein [Methanotrichaceae archaeon]HQI91054.1 hypothetical protein [Methanotrichaceae archaeon]